MLIGSKGSFAIDFIIRNSWETFTYAHLRIWLDGRFIGVYDDASPIYPVYNELKHLYENHDKISIQDLDEDSAIELFKTVLVSADPSVDKYLCSFGEAFDQFSIREFFSEGNYWFVWQLQKMNNIWKELDDYPEEIYCAKVSGQEFEKVFLAFQHAIHVYISKPQS